LIDNLPEYIFAKDAEGRFAVGNAALARHMGVDTPDDLIGKTDFDFYPQELAARFYADEQALFQSGQSILDHEEATLDPAGNPQWTLTAKVLLRDNQGKVTGLVGVSREITERKQAEEALRMAHDELDLRVLERTTELEQANESLQGEIAQRRRMEEALRETESHLRSLMESAERYAVFRLAVDPTQPYGLRIVLASPSLKELLGLSELTDVSTWVGNIHPDDLERTVKANTRSIETGTLFDEQYRVFKPEPGEWEWVHNRSTPVFDARHAHPL